jgi:hypothetical protein
MFTGGINVAVWALTTICAVDDHICAMLSVSSSTNLFQKAVL